jgi:phage terminase large subunit-like protein
MADVNPILMGDESYAELARRAAYKSRQYFHDCQPGCKPWSLKRADHVALEPGKPPTCRVLYQKSLTFFRAGVKHRERLFLAANRIGKTDTAAYEVRCHMTGEYPPWWEGYRFTKPSRWVAAGDTMLTTRDIIQVALLGPHEHVPLGKWCGMLDTHLVADITRKAGGVVNCVDTIYVTHNSGGRSSLQFKSYDMGRRVFQGFEAEGIWLDEEPPEKSEQAEGEAQGSSDIYTEALLRTMTTDGMIIATFTPLRGQTPFLVNYLETAVMAGPNGTDVDAKSNFYPDILDGGSHAEA